jgi:predicted MFS family arabinose efflux permease
LLYDELVNAKPKVVVVAAAATEVVDRLVVKASHMQSSGDLSIEGVSSIVSTYAFVIVITAVILFILYRSLRKHRIGGLHRHGGRWK